MRHVRGALAIGCAVMIGCASAHEGSVLDGGGGLDVSQLDGGQPDGAQLDGAELDGAEPDGAEPDVRQLDGARLDASLDPDAQVICEGPMFTCVTRLPSGCCADDMRSPICLPNGTLACPDGTVPRPTCPTTGCASEDWRTCATPSDCVLAANDCCGWCGLGTIEDVDAVNALRTAEHFQEVCPVPTPCPACPAGDLDPHVVATCEALLCRAVDLDTLPLTECMRDEDCIAQYSTCCGCGGADDDVVAVRADIGRAGLDALLCAGGACLMDCAPQVPPGRVATCVMGRCVAMFGMD